MEVQLLDIGRRFNQGWVFRNINQTFKTNEHVVFRGSNGSGKSTLLQVILGNLTASEGEVKFNIEGQDLDHDGMLHNVSICAPYQELIEEFTLVENLEFQQKLIPFRDNLSIDSIVDVLSLKEHKNKELRSFSSGMKQRVKLAMAILADTQLVLLDEPASNLDKSGIEWYDKLVGSNSADRLFIVCSNSSGEEFEFCTKELNLLDFKQ